MPTSNKATVQSAVPKGTKDATALQIWDSVCSAGAQCQEVQSSPVASVALTGLKDRVTAATKSLKLRTDASLAWAAANKSFRGDFADAQKAARTYQAAVGGVAGGDPAVIAKSGLKARVPVPGPVALEKVTVVHSKAGKHSSEAILTWPRAPGATGYAIEVNFTPQNPAGVWTALTSGTGRRRTVKAPTPGSQFLARVASLGTGGTQSDWSDPILCTTAF